MNCPVCGKEMEQGKVAFAPPAGIHFLPPDEKHLPHLVTKRGVENRGGTGLLPPANFGLLESSGTLPGWICRSCRKVVMEY